MTALCWNQHLEPSNEAIRDKEVIFVNSKGRFRGQWEEALGRLCSVSGIPPGVCQDIRRNLSNWAGYVAKSLRLSSGPSLYSLIITVVFLPT